VKPPPFRYTAPTTVAEAVDLLIEHANAEPRVLAGGQSLVPLMNFRLAQPGHVIDLRRVAGLCGIRTEGDTLVIGAMTRQAEVEDAPEVAVVAPLLAEAIGFVAHRPIRNSGTIGGSLAHADPAAELPAVALALDAELVAAGPAGSRSIPAASFFRGPFSTALRAEEILTELRLPRREGGHAFVEFARTHGSFAIVAVAAVVRVADGRIADAAVALAGVAPTPVRAAAAEDALVGTELAAVDAAGVVAAAADAAAAALRPAGDVHASAVTRTDLARVCVRRALELALSRAQDRR
jgi:aerobic carbon-monoxide dehydrogenase medium subunit